MAKWNVGGLIGYIITYIVIFSVGIGGILFYLLPSLFVALFSIDIIGLFLYTSYVCTLFIMTGIIVGVLTGLMHFVKKEERDSSYLHAICGILKSLYWIIFFIVLMGCFTGGFALISFYAEIFMIGLGFYYSFVGMITLMLVIMIIRFVLNSIQFFLWLLVKTGAVSGALLTKTWIVTIRSIQL